MSDADAVDVQALLERVATLEAQVAVSQPPPQNTFVPPTFRDFKMRPELLATTPIFNLSGSDLPRGMRELRQLAAAVALCRDEPVPAGRDIPSSYPQLMRRIHTARKGGATWRAALESAGLPVPDADRVAELALALRDDLRERPLWDGLLPAVAAINAPGRATAHVKSDTFKALRDIMI